MCSIKFIYIDLLSVTKWAQNINNYMQRLNTLHWKALWSVSHRIGVFQYVSWIFMSFIVAWRLWLGKYAANCHIASQKAEGYCGQVYTACWYSLNPKCEILNLWLSLQLCRIFILHLPWYGTVGPVSVTHLTDILWFLCLFLSGGCFSWYHGGGKTTYFWNDLANVSF